MAQKEQAQNSWSLGKAWGMYRVVEEKSIFQLLTQILWPLCGEI